MASSVQVIYIDSAFEKLTPRTDDGGRDKVVIVIHISSFKTSLKFQQTLVWSRYRRLWDWGVSRWQRQYCVSYPYILGFENALNLLFIASQSVIGTDMYTDTQYMNLPPVNPLNRFLITTGTAQGVSPNSWLDAHFALVS